MTVYFEYFVCHIFFLQLLLQSCQLVEDVSGFSNGKQTTLQILQIINASSDVKQVTPAVATDVHPFLRAIPSTIAVLLAEVSAFGFTILEIQLF